MIALSEPWGTVVLLIVTLSVVSAVLWRLHLHAEKLRRDLREVIDRLDKQMASQGDRAIDRAVEDATTKAWVMFRARAEWFQSHEPTRRAIELVAQSYDEDRAEAVAEWQRVLALHDAQAKADADAARTKLPTRKNK